LGFQAKWCEFQVGIRAGCFKALFRVRYRSGMALVEQFYRARTCFCCSEGYAFPAPVLREDLTSPMAAFFQELSVRDSVPSVPVLAGRFRAVWPPESQTVSGKYFLKISQTNFLPLSFW
jgi:hypothetical protein